ncbi:Acetoin catabolism regulatory protein [Burkholderiaceae bacterium]|nr:Acetoin catabolism regulatory protein [Burkholderiaceae bacterium]
MSIENALARPVAAPAPENDRAHHPGRNWPLETDPFSAVELGDPTIETITARLRRAARSNIPILFNGETGTGKEVFARTVHEASLRRDQPFVAVNCASIPESLIESVLFGHCGGAFTGASSRGSPGLVRQADKGTLFLDEIGDMPLNLQSSLLRVLAEGEITPLGAQKAVRIDIRVLCATHRDLIALVRQGRFREDLLFRLRGLAVTLPPLRLRSDMRALIAKLVRRESLQAGHPISIGEDAVSLLLSLDWPGNIRELKQVLGAAISMSDDHRVTARDIEDSLHGIGTGIGAGTCGHAPANAHTPAPQMPAPPMHHGGVPPGEDNEREELLRLLRRHRWNISRAAHETNAARTTIYRRMSRLQIVPPHLRDL